MKGKNCKQCGVVGHFAKVCPNEPMDSAPNVNTIDQFQNNNHENDPDSPNSFFRDYLLRFPNCRGSQKQN